MKIVCSRQNLRQSLETDIPPPPPFGEGFLLESHQKSKPRQALLIPI